ncbi:MULTISPECIES: ABC transporter permease [Rhizobium]|uniref:Putrescine transport system permease protein potH n=1 Tax=Rhizobium favelukesii TaxID=348824 RepID=W6RK99_9HYPH|nr:MULTISPECIES: ABC transporter permease [Rhizobium]MCA0807107.1 ABC transporter permease [Rhizobium sp. T1473]MCS0460170.1 ABC transporter permease [Rhizobium favelukesii]UFS85467.1 ABC transporter permease [Rhizobium sp. T136]CDM60745.1 Putrescine transport system permease protein potH [Rhizobium favelukesii]
MAVISLEDTERRKAWGFVAPALAWTVVFFVAPFLFMAAMSLRAQQGGSIVRVWNFGNYIAFFEKGALFRGLTNSLEITAIVTVLSILLAYPLAWIIAERVPQKFQRTALILAVLPFWTSYVVRSYSWLLVLSRNGVINQTLMNLGVISEPLELASNRTATVIGFVHFFVMLLTLTIYANLVQLSPNYRRAAADLGANAYQTFRHVILPLTMPGIMTGAFLTFVLCIGDYVTPQILGGNNELVLPQIIMLQLGRRADFPMAAALSIILMLAVTAAYVACARWLKIERT